MWVGIGFGATAVLAVRTIQAGWPVSALDPARGDATPAGADFAERAPGAAEPPEIQQRSDPGERRIWMVGIEGNRAFQRVDGLAPTAQGFEGSGVAQPGLWIGRIARNRLLAGLQRLGSPLEALEAGAQVRPRVGLIYPCRRTLNSAAIRSRRLGICCSAISVDPVECGSIGMSMGAVNQKLLEKHRRSSRVRYRG